MNAFKTLLGIAGTALLLSASFIPDSTVSAQEVKNLTELVALDDRSALGELKYWNSVKESGDPELIKSYLENFPDGMFTDPALARYQQLAGKPLDGKLPAVGTLIENDSASIAAETDTEQVVKPKSKPTAGSQAKKTKKAVNKTTKKKTVAKKKTKSVVAAAPQKAKVVKKKTAAKKKQCSVQTADGSPCPTKVVAKPVKKKKIETGGGGGGGGWGG